MVQQKHTKEKIIFNKWTSSLAVSWFTPFCVRPWSTEKKETKRLNRNSPKNRTLWLHIIEMGNVARATYASSFRVHVSERVRVRCIGAGIVNSVQAKSHLFRSFSLCYWKMMNGTLRSKWTLEAAFHLVYSSICIYKHMRIRRFNLFACPLSHTHTFNRNPSNWNMVNENSVSPAAEMESAVKWIVVRTYAYSFWHLPIRIIYATFQ